MSSYQLTTARSAFTEVKADKRCPCAGCGGSIPLGADMLTKPFFRKGNIVGQTRLHTLQSCWEDYDEATVNALIHRRDNRTGAIR